MWLTSKQASKQSSNNNNKHSFFPLWSLLRLIGHCPGLYSTVAVLNPRWWPCEIQVLSQKLTASTLGQGPQVGGGGECLPKAAHFVPQNSFFRPITALVKTAKATKRVLQFTCALTLLSQRPLCCPLTVQYVRETGKK